MYHCPMTDSTTFSEDTSLHRATILPSPIRVIAFEILERCNLYCDFCVRSASYQLSGILSPDRFEARASKAKDAFQQLDLVALTGGEPFLHPDIQEIINIAQQMATKVCITTNGTILKEENFQFMSRLQNFHLIISIDGPSADIHDLVRGKAGTFDKLLQFTALCQQYGIPFLVNMTVNEKNQHQVYETVALARELGAKDISVALVKPEGRGKAIENQPEVFTNVARQMYAAKSDLESASFKVTFTEVLSHVFDVTLTRYYRGCQGTSNSLHVQCDGNILLCTSCKESLGNIDDDAMNLAVVCEQDERRNIIAGRDGLGGACGSCEFRMVCGGCRCRAALGEEGFLGGDPLCPKNNISPRHEEIQTRMIELQESLWTENAQEPEALEAWYRAWQESESVPRQKRNFAGQRRWGHNMALSADRILEGEMGWRHRDILIRWLENDILPLDLSGHRILDIGPWTGGESCLLAAMGASVYVFEESPENREAIETLARQFQLPIEIRGQSLYELAETESGNYDYVYLSGILAHVSDPVAALRICFNQLKDGGRCLIETSTSYASDGQSEFWGKRRQGRIWWNPSREALLELLHNAGFDQTRIIDFDSNKRIQLSATRTRWSPMELRMGISHPGIS